MKVLVKLAHHLGAILFSPHAVKIKSASVLLDSLVSQLPVKALVDLSLPFRGTGGLLPLSLQRKPNRRPHMLSTACVYGLPVSLNDVFANSKT